MNIKRAVKIIGSGKYVPEKVVTSVQIESELGLPEGWCEKFSGVIERRKAENETNVDLAVKALEDALINAGIRLEELDLIISASATVDYILPYEAALILKQIDKSGNLRIATMNVDSSCLSFISAFEVASSLIDNERYKRIAVVTAEVASIGLVPDHMETYTLFGDGAAAAILEYDESGESGIIKCGMKTWPEGYEWSIIPGGGNKLPIRYNEYDPVKFSFNMEGKKLLRLAKKAIPEYVDDFFKDTPVKIEDVDVIVAHQASKAGLTLFADLYPNINGIVYSNIHKYGNCIAASIPLGLHDVVDEGILRKGDYCLLIGTAAGFAIGSVLFKY